MISDNLIVDSNNADIDDKKDEKELTKATPSNQNEHVSPMAIISSGKVSLYLQRNKNGCDVTSC